MRSKDQNIKLVEEYLLCKKKVIISVKQHSKEFTIRVHIFKSSLIKEQLEDHLFPIYKTNFAKIITEFNNQNQPKRG